MKHTESFSGAPYADKIICPRFYGFRGYFHNVDFLKLSFHGEIFFDGRGFGRGCGGRFSSGICGFFGLVWVGLL